MSTEPEPVDVSSHTQKAHDQDGALPESLRSCTHCATRGEFWQAVQQSIKDRLGLERFGLWFRQSELMSADDQRIVVGVPNVIIQQFLTAKYAGAVAAAVEGLVGRPMEVSFDVAPRLFRQMRASRSAELRQSGLEAGHLPGTFRARAPVSPPSEWGFDRLIVCRPNRLPFAAARELAGQENPRFRFLHVSGDYGSGKTALLRAIFALAGGPERGLAPVLMTAEDWCNEYYLAIQRKTTHLFRARFRSCGMFLLDDVQFVQGKAGGQLELLHTVKHILDRDGRVALSGTPHPDELQEIDPALRSLLKGAFPAVLLPPAPDERLEVVKELAARRGLNATRDVLRLIADRYGESFTAMESAVCRLVLYAGVEGCGKVELTAAQCAFAAMQPVTARPADLGAIKAAVGEAFHVTAEQLGGKSRSRTVCRARHAAIYLARRLTGASLTEVGRAFGGMSHSSVKHAADKTAADLAADAQLSSLIERLEKRLSGA